MIKLLLVLTLLSFGSVFAQDMSATEDYNSSYVEMPDGSSRYIGKCSTHEDYDKFYFKTFKVIQKYVEPGDLTDVQIKSLLAKFDNSLIHQVLKTLGMYDVATEGASDASILKDYIDDITVESITNEVFPDLNLIRFNVGVGGGNGAHVVINKNSKGIAVKYELMSYTFDSDLNYCDKKVWLQNNN
jgi:hypothetical protein